MLFQLGFQMVEIWQDCNEPGSCKHFGFCKNVYVPEADENAGEN